jgi:hypothetical protein
MRDAQDTVFRVSSEARQRVAQRRRRLPAAIVVITLLGAGATAGWRRSAGDVQTGAAAAHGAQIERYTVHARFVRRPLRDARGDARRWLDGGTKDLFRAAGKAFAAALGIPMRHWEGEHESDYRRAQLDRYLRFYADALESC